MRTLRHTIIAAYGALFISLGGTGYAATQLAPNSVGSAQVRNGSIQSRDLARGVLSRKNARLSEAITQVVSDPATGLNISVTAKDGAPGPVGPQGPAGADSTTVGPMGPQGAKGDTGAKGETGAQGPAGTTVGSGYVAPGNACYPTACNLDYVSYTHPTDTTYCLSPNVNALSNKAAVVTMAGGSNATATVTKNPAAPCAGATWMVEISGTNNGFYLIVS